MGFENRMEQIVPQSRVEIEITISPVELSIFQDGTKL
jgi:hypothetical protein